MKPSDRLTVSAPLARSVACRCAALPLGSLHRRVSAGFRGAPRGGLRALGASRSAWLAETHGSPRPPAFRGSCTKPGFSIISLCAASSLAAQRKSTAQAVARVVSASRHARSCALLNQGLVKVPLRRKVSGRGCAAAPKVLTTLPRLYSIVRGSIATAVHRRAGVLVYNEPKHKPPTAHGCAARCAKARFFNGHPMPRRRKGGGIG